MISDIIAVSPGRRASNKLDDTRQTTDDILRLGRLTRDLRDDVARLDLLAVLNHQVRPDRHLVGLERLVAVLDLETRLIFLIRVLDHETLLTRDLIDLFFDRFAFLQVLVLDRTLHLGQDGERERIPRDEHVVLFDLLAVLDVKLSTVNNLVMSDLTAAIVDSDAISD